LDSAQSMTFRANESGLRHTVLRAVSALMVTVASLLLFMTMPLLPRELMVFVAIGLGALSYKVPTLALVLMVLLTIPGYAYQISNALPAGVHVPVPMVAAMGAMLLVIAVLAGEMGGTLGVAVGVIAAVLMLTPFHALALPLIIATVLFRTKHAQVSVLVAMLTFAILYYPVLAIGGVGAPEAPVPILERVSFHTSPPVPTLGLDAISTRLSEVMRPSADSVSPYIKSLTEYWPLSPEKRLLPASIIFVLLAGAALGVGAGILLLFRWLRKREVVSTRLFYAAPVACMLGAIFAFAYLSRFLALPLDYSIATNLVFTLIGGIVAGGCGSAVEIWMGRRDATLGFRELLAERAAAVRTDTDLLKNRTSEAKALCPRIDTSGDDALRRMCQQELDFTEQAVVDMSLLDLRKKTVVFDELRDKLREAVQESNARLYKYHDEDWQTYNHCLMLANGYGFALGETIQGPDFSSLTSMDYAEVVKLQTALNQRYETSARTLAEGVEKLVTRIRSEVDPDFKRAGLDIANDYLAQRRYGEGLQEFLQELSEIEYALGRTVSGLDKEIRAVLDRLKTIATEVLIPTAANLGDEVSVRYYREFLGEVEKLFELPGEKARLPDFMRLVSVVCKLGELVAELGSRLSERIGTLEMSVQDKTPPGYSWRIDPESLKRVTELSKALRSPNGTTGIHEHISLLKTGPSIVDSAAHAAREYSVAHELLINYANVEYLVDEKLGGEGLVRLSDLPVHRKYAAEYLELYRLKHPGQVRIERDMGVLTSLSDLPKSPAKR